MSNTTDIRIVVRGGVVHAVYTTIGDIAFEVLDMDNAEAEGPTTLAAHEQTIKDMDKDDSDWRAVD